MTRRNRALVIVAAGVWSTVTIGCPAPATAESVPDGANINRVIPQQAGKFACFAENFNDVPLDSEHVTPPAAPGGTATYRFTTHKVRRVVLQLEYQRAAARPDDEDVPGYDRLYEFTLEVQLANRKSALHAFGECRWRDHDFESKDGKTRVPLTASALHCSIECDGGGMTLERVTDTASLMLRLDPNERLRMTGPCSGHTGNVVFNGRDQGREFRLATAKASICRPLARWLKTQ